MHMRPVRPGFTWLWLQTHDELEVLFEKLKEIRDMQAAHAPKYEVDAATAHLRGRMDGCAGPHPRVRSVPVRRACSQFFFSAQDSIVLQAVCVS